MAIFIFSIGALIAGALITIFGIVKDNRSELGNRSLLGLNKAGIALLSLSVIGFIFGLGKEIADSRERTWQAKKEQLLGMPIRSAWLETELDEDFVHSKCGASSAWGGEIRLFHIGSGGTAYSVSLNIKCGDIKAEDLKVTIQRFFDNRSISKLGDLIGHELSLTEMSVPGHQIFSKIKLYANQNSTEPFLLLDKYAKGRDTMYIDSMTYGWYPSRSNVKLNWEDDYKKPLPPFSVTARVFNESLLK